MTPIQTSKNYKNYYSFKNRQDYKILKETKILHQKTKDLSKTQIIEFSILFIILNYSEIAAKKLEDLSKIKFLAEKNESLKNIILSSISDGNYNDGLNFKLNEPYDQITKEINENSNIQIIIKNKNEQDISNLLDDLIKDHIEQDNLKKIESLEQKLINNLDENSYSELIKLKSQLNRD